MRKTVIKSDYVYEAKNWGDYLLEKFGLRIPLEILWGLVKQMAEFLPPIKVLSFISQLLEKFQSKFSLFKKYGVL